ncbi:hypothetical protein JVW24_26780, partial [Vibrio cholerae O1]|nr:hypothetical protein [Vibrio cholerae O1]
APWRSGYVRPSIVTLASMVRDRAGAAGRIGVEERAGSGVRCRWATGRGQELGAGSTMLWDREAGS